MINGQSAAKLLELEEGSTTIPWEGSSLMKILSEKPDIIVYPMYNYRLPQNINMYNCIYFIFNIKYGGKVYVGSSKNLKKRLQKHREAISKNKHHSKYLQRVSNLHGKENLYYGVLETGLITEDTETKEKFWIDHLDCWKNGFNSTNDTKRVLVSEQVIKDNVERTSKAVKMYNMSGEFIKEFSSVSSAARYTSNASSNISLACKGKFRHLKNFAFRYSKDTIDNLNIEIPKSTRFKVAREVSILKTSKKVECKINDTVVIYNSISDCERENNIPRGVLYKCIKNKRPYKGEMLVNLL